MIVNGTYFKKDVRKLAKTYEDNTDAYQKAVKVISQNFDKTHSIDRALEVQSIDSIIALAELRSTLITKLIKDYRTHTNS